MPFPSKAEYYASRAADCRVAQAAAPDPASAFAHGELAARYDACSAAASASFGSGSPSTHGDRDERASTLETDVHHGPSQSPGRRPSP